jgi:hypothetical protein
MFNPAPASAKAFIARGDAGSHRRTGRARMLVSWSGKNRIDLCSALEALGAGTLEVSRDGTEETT